MAKFFPAIEHDFNNSYGEQQIFDALHQLPDDWYIFHSIRWSKRTRYGSITWGEADFVIFNQIYGMLVLEVKSGIITCQNGVFKQKRIDNTEEHDIDPFKQADRSKYTLKEKLQDCGLDDSCFIDKAVWFPSIDDDFSNVNLPLDYHKELILTQKDLATPLQSLTRIFDFYHAKSYTDLYNDDLDQIFQFLIPYFNLIPAFGSTKKEIAYQLNQLTKEQKKILDFIDDEDSAAIAGAAGTGKTFIALERARRLADTDKKVLYLCFNRQLRDFLDGNNEEPNIDILNIHQFLYQHGLLTSLDESQITLTGKFTFENDDYIHCVIDEAQDFDSNILATIIKEAKARDIGITLFYDKNQLVIKDKLPEIINDFDCKLTLKNNCRNTVKIIETLTSSINMEPNPSHLSAQGTKPTMHYSPSADKIIAGIGSTITQYLKEGFSVNDITILTLNTTDTSILTGTKAINQYQLSEKKAENFIQFTTARKFKGLESDCIIIVDYDFDKIDDQEYSKLFYVATSRARQQLDIFSITDDDTINSIGSKINGVFNPILKLSNRLKTTITKI